MSCERSRRRSPLRTACRPWSGGRDPRLNPAKEDVPTSAFTFVFSPRRDTEAATLGDQVPHPVKRERMERLVELVQRRALERSERFIGTTQEVLVEGPSRTDPARLRGRTRHNKTVNFAGLAQPGELVHVVITGATSTTLSGEELFVARALG